MEVEPVRPQDLYLDEVIDVTFTVDGPPSMVEGDEPGHSQRIPP